MADDLANAGNDGITIEQASQLLHYSSGNDRYRVELAPNYSEELGFSMKGAAGAYLTDEIALGLIVEYGENKSEYLANAGIQFNDALSLVGTVGMLQEAYEYVDGDGRKSVQQMEYGASLKGAYEVGILSGFELNGYLANADASSDTVETGKLYGAQLLADLDLTSTTHIKLGGGYEWLEWDDGDNNNSLAFSAEGTQQLGDMLSINGNASVGASENVYGGGLALDLSNGGLNTNSLALNYSYIDGRNGIEDDQRVELSWTVGFGAGPSASVAAADLTEKSGTIRAAADVAMVSPANNLLNDVMQRPAYLPKTVIGRGVAAVAPTCDYNGAISQITSDGLFISAVGVTAPNLPADLSGVTARIASVDIIVDGVLAGTRSSSAFDGGGQVFSFVDPMVGVPPKPAGGTTYGPYAIRVIFKSGTGESVVCGEKSAEYFTADPS